MSEPLRVLLAGCVDVADALQAGAAKCGYELAIERSDEASPGSWDLIVATADTLPLLAAHNPGTPLVVPGLRDDTAMALAIQVGASVVPNGSPRLLALALERALLVLRLDSATGEQTRQRQSVAGLARRLGDREAED